MKLWQLAGWVLLSSSLCCGSPGTADAGSGGGAGGGGAGGSGGCDGAAKTPLNVVSNAGFECGEMGFSPQAGTLEVVTDAHTGSKALKLTATASGDGVFASTKPIVTNATAAHYCATAWAKGTVRDAHLSVLTSKTGGGVDTYFASPIATTTWIRIPPSTVLAVPNTAGFSLYVRFVMSGGAAGDTLLIDDVDVWESADGKCNEVR